MKNNLTIINPLLTFDSEDEFYFLQVIQRKKDRKDSDLVKCVGSNNHSRLIKAYYIYSVEQLERYMPEIIALCDMFKARAGINLNKRNRKNVALEVLEMTARDIRCGNYSCISKVYNSACGSSKGTDKLWLVDIDIDNIKFVEQIAYDINKIEPTNKGKKDIAIIPSKSGYHLITKPFNRQEFSKMYSGIEVHTNNPVNLYIP